MNYSGKLGATGGLVGVESGVRLPEALVHLDSLDREIERITKLVSEMNSRLHLVLSEGDTPDVCCGPSAPVSTQLSRRLNECDMRCRGIADLLESIMRRIEV